MKQFDRPEAERLVNTYSDTILRLSYTYLHSVQDAEDICQTVFLKLLTNEAAFDSPAHEKAWIIRTAVNACKADEVIFRPGDVEGAPYGNEVLPEEVVVLAPGQNRVPVQGSDDIWVSAMGIAGDGCFHVRLAFAEGVEAERDWNVAAFPRNEEDYGAAHFTAMIRRVENGLDILFPLLHAGEAERLDHIWFAGSYTRPGTEIAGGWSMDFPFVYHASKTLDWIGEIDGHQVTQATVSPLNVTMRIRGDSDIGEWRDMTARLRDGTVVETSPGTSSHMNRAAWENDSEEQWEIYSTWAFSEPVDVEDIVSLTVMGVTIPVEAG